MFTTYLSPDKNVITEYTSGPWSHKLTTVKISRLIGLEAPITGIIARPRKSNQERVYLAIVSTEKKKVHRVIIVIVLILL